MSALSNKFKKKKKVETVKKWHGHLVRDPPFVRAYKIHENARVPERAFIDSNGRFYILWSDFMKF